MSSAHLPNIIVYNILCIINTINSTYNFSFRMFMCVSVCVYIHIHLHIYVPSIMYYSTLYECVCVLEREYILLYMFVWVFMYYCVYWYVWIYSCEWIYICVCVCTCVYVCMCVYMCWLCIPLHVNNNYMSIYKATQSYSTSTINIWSMCINIM